MQEKRFVEVVKDEGGGPEPHLREKAADRCDVRRRSEILFRIMTPTSMVFGQLYWDGLPNPRDLKGQQHVGSFFFCFAVPVSDLGHTVFED